MQITIDGTQYTLPTSLSDITLAARVEYDNTYGRDMRLRLDELVKMPEGYERELEVGEYQCDVACKSLSFFGNIPLDVVQNTMLNEVLAVYDACMKSISDEYNFDNEDFTITHEFDWNGDVWAIAPPELKSASAMTFGEFLDAKQWVKDLFEFSNQRWGSLVALCCIFFRKKGEAYTEALSDPEGERHKLMLTLPLDYALHVGFFLSDSMLTYTRTFLSSIPAEVPVSPS